MASDVGTGDSEVPTLLVAPADGTTAVTLEVRPPTGSPYPLTMTGGALQPIPNSTDQQQLWTATSPVVYSEPGRWVLHFASANTGEGVEDLEVYVAASPVAGGPTWTPGRSRVANYVPHRTLVRNTASTLTSADTFAWTFDSTTTPPGVSVDRLIADGVDWVTALITPLHAKSEKLAALLAALWAAIALERAWPDDDDSLQRANDMEKQLTSMLAALRQSNDDANNGTDNGFDIVYPYWAFPAADCRWDSATYW